jgi:peptide deformylase
VLASAIGRDGKPFTLEAEGLLARCIQHETDHLEGVLLIDRMRDVDRMAVEPELREREILREAERRDAVAAARA